MSEITLRLVKDSPLTNQEVDDNFANLNSDKVEIGGDLSGNTSSPTVTGIQGIAISNTAPSNNQVLAFSGTQLEFLDFSSTTAQSLETPRNINGVPFDGTSDITVPGNFTERTEDESGHVVFIGTTATGNKEMYTNSNYRFNPSSGEVSATDFNSTSDINLKENIKEIDNALDLVSKMRGVKYTWKNNNKSGVGVIAQEIEKILPEVVSNRDEYMTVSYGNIVGVLVEAIKEQQQQINQLNSIVKKLTDE